MNRYQLRQRIREDLATCTCTRRDAMAFFHDAIRNAQVASSLTDKADEYELAAAVLRTLVREEVIA